MTIMESAAALLNLPTFPLSTSILSDSMACFTPPLIQPGATLWFSWSTSLIGSKAGFTPTKQPVSIFLIRDKLIERFLTLTFAALFHFASAQSFPLFASTNPLSVAFGNTARIPRSIDFSSIAFTFWTKLSGHSTIISSWIWLIIFT